MNFYCVYFLSSSSLSLPPGTRYLERKRHHCFDCVLEVQAYTAEDALSDFKIAMTGLDCVKVDVPDDCVYKIMPPSLCSVYKIKAIKSGSLNDLRDWHYLSQQY